LQRAQAELLDFGGTGMSIMEHSHRGKQYEAVHNEAIALLRELMDISAEYDVLFLQGGASQQFAQVPMNWVAPGGKADYVLTGAWSEKAYAEARAVAALSGGQVRIAADSGTGEGKARTYVRVPRPEETAVDPSAAYVHVTSNETIHGVEFAVAPGAEFPTFGSAPLICDMSSDFLWRKLDVSRFGLIYAGAQKNLGPSGVLLAIARKDLVERGRKDIPAIFQYRTYSQHNSLYNTPPTFAIYLVRNVLAWVKEQGGLLEIERRNREKARLIYGAVDAHPDFYRCPVELGSRSVMNAVFRLPTPELEDAFVSRAAQQQMVGLKGHRSVGGIRVSLYNAIPVEWAQALASFMADFARTHG
jgi:phosphoserine aminotransferase